MNETIPNTPTRRNVLAGLPAVAAGLGAFGVTAAASADDHAEPGGMKTHKKLMSVLSSMHDGSEYTLPPLPYAYDAVSDAIDEQTMRLHHDKHHMGYVTGLNKATAALDEATKNADAPLVSGLSRDLSFNYGGHVLHSIFWATMGPCEDGAMGGKPIGALATAIDKSFGSFDGFVTLWTKVAGTVKGSGWVQLVFDPVAVRLNVVGVTDHDLGFTPGAMPLLPLDIWEHAFYLKYQNKKADYVKAHLTVVDWSCVGALYEMVSAPTSGLSKTGSYSHGNATSVALPSFCRPPRPRRWPPQGHRRRMRRRETAVRQGIVGDAAVSLGMSNAL